MSTPSIDNLLTTAILRETVGPDDQPSSLSPRDISKLYRLHEQLTGEPPPVEEPFREEWDEDDFEEWDTPEPYPCEECGKMTYWCEQCLDWICGCLGHY